MFSICTSLTSAPQLLATTLASNCYNGMFFGCSKLNNITMLATDISASRCLTNWVYNVSSSGTFVKHPSMISLPNGSDGVPYGWTVKNISTIIMNPLSTVINFYYSNGIYTPDYSGFLLNTVYSENEILSLTPECDILIDLYIRNDYPQEYQWATTKSFGDVLYEFNVYDSNEATVVIKDIIIIDSGNGYYYYNVEEKEPFVEKDWFRIVSLSDNNTISLTKDIDYSINGESWEQLSANNQITVNNNDIVYFKGIELQQQFSVSNKFNVEGNIMSLIYNNDFEGQTDLSGKDKVFNNLFSGCTQLIDASKLVLPATQLATYCYTSMFSYCTSLTSAPNILPSTTLVNYCYNNMFTYCTSLTEAPQLPATTLASYCYLYMFSYCTSLTTAPQLPATTLVNYCYYGMFYNCTSLTTAPQLPATTLVDSCYIEMFIGCTSLTTAPELLATTLKNWCYSSMFKDCTSLNYIKMLATDISASRCLSRWVDGVTNEGTFVKHPSMISLPNGKNGIPNGWTVINNNE
jgi:hypothetical protein